MLLTAFKTNVQFPLTEIQFLLAFHTVLTILLVGICKYNLRSDQSVWRSEQESVLSLSLRQEKLIF